MLCLKETIFDLIDLNYRHFYSICRFLNRVAACSIFSTFGPNAEDVETFEDEIELHNPQVALQMLGKYHEQFIDKLKIEVTWQDEAIALIEAGQITYAAALEAFDHDDTLIRQLFAKAKKPIVLDE